MSIIQTITLSSFVGAFQRMSRGEQFSHSALEALFDFYDSLGEDVELDPIAICCDWCEYGSALEAALEYGYEPDSDLDAEEQGEDATDWLADRTFVLPADSGSVVVASF